MAKPVPKLNISLAETFAALPESIKDWLASEQCTLFISEINKKLGLKEEKRSIIPRLIMRLVLKDLELPEFINELSGALDMNFQAAKALAQEIEQKILNPIAMGLKQDVGIDVKLIYFGKPKPIEEGPAPLKMKAEAPPQPVAEMPEKKMPQPQPMPRKEPEIKEAPALIYKKGTFGRVPISKPTPPAPPPIKPYKAEPSGFKPKPETKLKIETPVPEKATAPEIKVEKTTTLKPPIPPPATRIVHYSSFLTPLSNLDSKKKSGPKKEDINIEGNRVDLRFT